MRSDKNIHAIRALKQEQQRLAAKLEASRRYGVKDANLEIIIARHLPLQEALAKLDENDNYVMWKEK